MRVIDPVAPKHGVVPSELGMHGLLPPGSGLRDVYVSIGSNRDAPALGLITAVGPGRIIQFELKDLLMRPISKL